ncbi:MAG: hypothetical protein O3A20_06560 [Planctomycetota bacterium]|nr:hypothetical protein [Planctomycetota bacterium]
MSRNLEHTQALETRLLALETSNRRHRLGALGIALLAILGCMDRDERVPVITATLPPAEQGKVIEAESFVLRGPDGKVAAQLDFDNGGPRLVLFSEPEVPGVILRTEPRSSELRLDAKGKRRTHLEAIADLNIGRFSLVEDSGRVMAQIQTEGGACNYALLGAANPKGVRSMLNLVMPPVGPPSILLRDSEQKTRIIALDE